MDQRTRKILSKIDLESPEMINPRELKPVIQNLFYKKPMASKTANKESNGLPEKTKISTVINEVLRRCKNTSRNLDDHYLENVLKDYMAELKEGGYPKSWRMEILQSALKGYARFWKLEVEGKGYVNRPVWVTKNKRRAARLEGNKNWFQITKKETKDRHN